MIRPERKWPAIVLNASVWLKSDNRFAVLKNHENTRRPGDILEIDGEPWWVVNRTDRLEYSP